MRQDFTGYQNDAETGLDFAEARMYENRHGRFTAVDPLLASGKSANPQTFNRYVYVMNNPLILIDPSGLQAGVPLFSDIRCGSNCWGTSDGKGTVTANRSLGTVQSDPYEPSPVEMLVTSTGVSGAEALSGMGTGAENFGKGILNALTQPLGPIGSNLGIPNPLALERTAYDNPKSAAYGFSTEAFLTISTTAAGGAAIGGSSGSSLSVVPSRTGLSMEGLAFETKFLPRHIEGSSQTLNTLSKGKEVHVFNNLKTLSNAEATIFQQGAYNGFSRGYFRYSTRFERPVGTRIQEGKPDVPLFGAEIKIRPNGWYHVIPKP